MLIFLYYLYIIYYNVYILFIYLTELHIIEAFLLYESFPVFVFNDTDIFKSVYFMFLFKNLLNVYV